MRVPVASNDAMWLQDSATNLMVINAVFVTEQLDLATLREAFRVRVLGAEGGARFGRFRQRVVWEGGRPYWEEDPAFALERMIVPASVPSLETAEALQAYVAAEAGRPLPADRPAWQIQCIERCEPGTSAFIVRVHHSIGDGMALLTVIFTLMEEMTAEHPAAPPRGGIRPAAGAPGAGLLTTLLIPLAAPGILLRRLLWRPDRHSLHGPRVSGTKRVAWTRPLDIAVVKAATDRLGATVNDVLMATVSGAISRYLTERGEAAPARIRVSMPVNVRRPTSRIGLENKFAAVPLGLPAGIPHLADRVTAVKASLDALKRSVVPIVVYGIQRLLLFALPQAVSRLLIDFLANKCTAVVTNVPGPQREVTIAGRRIRQMVFWVPQRANIGVGLSILSFAGKVQVGILTDAAVAPDPGALARAFEAEFEELRVLGGGSGASPSVVVG